MESALAPTTGGENYLTQIDTGNQAASFTLRFSRPLTSFSFVIPELHPRDESGITFPAWQATAFDANGEILDQRADELRASYEAISAQHHTLRAPVSSSGIVTVRFDSDPRLNGAPFAAFSALMIEELVLEPR